MTKIPATSADYDRTRIIERPDGFYWQSRDAAEDSGPFATLLEAVRDMEYGDANLEVGETLEEAESEIGIADWLNPETGELAEEAIPRIEDL